MAEVAVLAATDGLTRVTQWRLRRGISGRDEVPAAGVALARQHRHASADPAIMGMHEPWTARRSAQMREVVDACLASDVASCVLSPVLRVDEEERSGHDSNLGRGAAAATPARSGVTTSGFEPEKGDDVVEELRATRGRLVVRRAPVAGTTNSSGVSKGRLVVVCRTEEVDRRAANVDRGGPRQLHAAVKDQLSLFHDCSLPYPNREAKGCGHPFRLPFGRSHGVCPKRTRRIEILAIHF